MKSINELKWFRAYANSAARFSAALIRSCCVLRYGIFFFIPIICLLESPFLNLAADLRWQRAADPQKFANGAHSQCRTPHSLKSWMNKVSSERSRNAPESVIFLKILWRKTYTTSSAISCAHRMVTLRPFVGVLSYIQPRFLIFWMSRCFHCTLAHLPVPSPSLLNSFCFVYWSWASAIGPESSQRAISLPFPFASIWPSCDSNIRQGSCLPRTE